MRTDKQDADPTTVCYRKKAYSKALAEKIAAGIRGRTFENVVAYACTRCGQWHVGHPSPEDEA